MISCILDLDLALSYLEFSKITEANLSKLVSDLS